ncbi:MAG: hypothetical protein U0166_05275 [Acidobacteriota bacterium]
MAEPIRFADLLLVLAKHDVEFIVVGGVAAILAGAPVATFDLDIVMRLSDDNRERLRAALEELRAVYHDPAGRHIVPDRERLATLKLHRLRTRLGALDVLTSIEPGWTYEDLLDRSTDYLIDGRRIRVLGLDAVIAAKEAADRDKDRAALPALKRARELRQQQEPGPPLPGNQKP